MKLIKFKGFSIEHKQWVYGYYVKSRDHHYILQQYNNSGYDERWETADWIEVDSKSVGQYTGVKDINDEEIYEGDVCKAPHDFGPAGWSDPREFVVHWDDKLGYQWSYWDLTQIVIIDNKYQN